MERINQFSFGVLAIIIILVTFQITSFKQLQIIKQETKTLDQDLTISKVSDRIDLNRAKKLIKLPSTQTDSIQILSSKQSNSSPSSDMNSLELNPAMTYSSKIVDNSLNQSPNPNIPSNSRITIPRINLNQKYQFGSMTNMSNLDKLLNQSVTAENVLTSDACIEGKNSYFMGHSEPVSASSKNARGSYVFSRVNELIEGDKINVINGSGKSCLYQVYKSFNVQTDLEDNVDIKTFNNLIYPNETDQSILTLQTCQKGSRTIRLIVRARLVKIY
jgi:sortase (surface protein transpeptidase)